MAEEKSDNTRKLTKAQEQEEQALRALYLKEIMSKIEKRLQENDPDVLKALKLIMDDNYKKKKN